MADTSESYADGVDAARKSVEQHRELFSVALLIVGALQSIAAAVREQTAAQQKAWRAADWRTGHGESVVEQIKREAD